MTDSSPLETNQEHLLQSALSTAFSNPDVSQVVRQSSTIVESSDIVLLPHEMSDTAGATPKDAHDEWKDEYENNLSRWKHEHAVQREKAESIRREWEQRRASGEVPPERDEYLGAHLAKAQARAEGGWETVRNEGAGVGSSSSNRDLGGHHTHLPQTVLPSGEPSDTASISTVQQDSEELGAHHRSPSNSSAKWDSFPSSLTSSYPSLSFPDSNSPPQGTAHHRKSGSHDHHHRQHDHHDPEHPNPPASLSVFDSSLSAKTRVIALLGSLTVNLFLPFVNGVMLGFGEIFSENVLFRYFGWRKTLGKSSIPGQLGLRR